MPVDISVKGVPDAVAEALRRRAGRHNRSLDEEVVGILRQSVEAGQGLTFGEFVTEGRANGGGSLGESSAMVREDRDAGHGD